MTVLEYDYNDVSSWLNPHENSYRTLEGVTFKGTYIMDAYNGVKEILDSVEVSIDGFMLGISDLITGIIFNDKFAEKLYNICYNIDNSCLGKIRKLLGYEKKVICGDDYFYFRTNFEYDITFFEALSRLMVELGQDDVLYDAKSIGTNKKQPKTMKFIIYDFEGQEAVSEDGFYYDVVYSNPLNELQNVYPKLVDRGFYQMNDEECYFINTTQKVL